MASFDFVDSASRAYQFVWDKRDEVLRFSAMVLALKMLSFAAFVAFGLQKDVLLQGLLLLPSHLLEGWVIATLIMMALYQYEAQEKNGQSIMPATQDMGKHIKASMIVYVLIKLMLSFVMGYTYEGQQGLPDTQPPDPTLQTFIVAVMIIVFLIWAFRFLWIYIPIVMGRSLGEYLVKFRAFSDSFPLLGVWILCFVPVVLVMLVMSQIWDTVSGALGFGSDSIVFDTGMAIIQALIDYALSLVSSLAVAYGMYSVFKGENKKTDIW